MMDFTQVFILQNQVVPKPSTGEANNITNKQILSAVNQLTAGYVNKIIFSFHFSY